jgi:hypothetical protein
VFTLNGQGDVAFLAFDGQHWGIYLYSDARKPSLMDGHDVRKRIPARR